MKFGRHEATRFGTPDGAYSRVTETEYSDSQITLADYEQFLAESHFGKNNIHRGRVSLSPSAARKPFRLFPSGRAIHLNLIYPKPEKEELRLYLSLRAGFKPEPHDVWFIFRKGADLWLGSLPHDKWDEFIAR